MAQLKPTKTVYTIGDFLDWQRSGALQLTPIFQRRQVWDPKAKSLLIDTVLNGLPIPIVFLRKTQDLKRLSSGLEVVDGQQRLRTLFSFIDPTVLSDYDPARDQFTVLGIHNKNVAGLAFRRLSNRDQAAILGYELSTNVLPPDTADEVVLRIFSRLNSTGAKLNHQELRNAEFFGAFKSLVYDLSIRNLQVWRKWKLFSDDDIARMLEAESVSDYLAAIMNGVQGKSQARLTALYRSWDDSLPGARALATRLQRVLDAIDDSVGALLPQSRIKRQALFYSLFTACYSHIYGFDSDYKKRKAPNELPKALPTKFRACDRLIADGQLSEEVLDAMSKATSDKGRRTTRHLFFMETLGLAAAK